MTRTRSYGTYRVVERQIIPRAGFENPLYYPQCDPSSSIIPFERILAVDEIGDAYNERPHLDEGNVGIPFIDAAMRRMVYNNASI